jgi:hypothetical protein
VGHSRRFTILPSSRIAPTAIFVPPISTDPMVIMLLSLLQLAGASATTQSGLTHRWVIDRPRPPTVSCACKRLWMSSIIPRIASCTLFSSSDKPRTATLPVLSALFGIAAPPTLHSVPRAALLRCCRQPVGANLDERHRNLYRRLLALRNAEGAHFVDASHAATR